MSKLYPPYIEGTIPAFYIKYDPTGSVVRGAALTVPFSMNPSVSEVSVAGFALRIKTVQTGAYVFSPCITNDYSFLDSTITFNLSATQASLLNEGLYYKILIAYCENVYLNSVNALASDSIGYYSTVGVIKCTSKPTVTISGLTNDSVNLFSNEYIGVYDATAGKDLTERVYSYNFKIYDEDNNLYWETEELIHSSANDTNYGFSTDRVTVNEFPMKGKAYSLLYTVTTLNGLILSSPKYKLTNDSFVTASKDIKIIINSNDENKDNYDNGYIKINFKGEQDVYRNKESVYYGEYLLTRSCEDDDYSVWLEISRFRLDDEEPSSVEIKDYTVELGKKYLYALLQYNLWGLYAEKIKSDKIEAGFEDSFLFDGEKYLKIRYNPKVSSFKTDILESKQDTIGGKFPFILRNGETNYKEFPIGGLIAAELDEQEFFVNRGYRALYRKNTFANKKVLGKIKNIPDEPEAPAAIQIEESNRTAEELAAVNAYLAIKQVYDETYGDIIAENVRIQNARIASAEAEEQRTITDEPYIRNYHDLTDDNVALERKFKLAVLDWLNDGKPKLFKSPTEGNYIVRLLNVSLAPEEKLGRMLHSFSCTAYEIAEVTYENLVKYGFLKIDEPSDYVGLWRSYDLEHDYLAGLDIIINFESNLVSFVAQDMFPGDIILIKYNDDGDYLQIQIGPTGSYYFNALGRTVTGLKITREDGLKQFGTIHCYYKGVRITEFDGITNIMLKTIPGMLFVGVNPYLLQAKSNSWRTSEGFNVLYPDMYKALEKTAFRDTLNHHTYKTGAAYTVDSEFINLIEKFEAGDILLIINSTIYTHLNKETNKEEVKDKVSLLNLELLKVKLRPLIPVYLVHSINENKKTVWESYVEERWVKYRLVEPVSLTPFGLPYPIEELRDALMLDPFCIFKVFGYAGNDEWKPISELDSEHYYIYTNDCSYYDAYYNTWASDYEPYFYINDKYNYTPIKYVDNDETYGIYKKNENYYFINKGKEIKFSTIIEKNTDDTFSTENILYIKQDKEYLPLCVRGIDKRGNTIYKLNENVEIAHTNQYTPNKNITYYIRQNNEVDLSVTSEANYKNLGAVSKLVLGNGVIAEATFLLKVIDYYTEDTNALVKAAKNKYIKDSTFLLNLSVCYEILDEANTYKKLYKAYIEAYNLLINGNKDTYLTDESKQIITASLANPNTKYEMLLVGVYRTYYTSTQLDSASKNLVNNILSTTDTDEAIEYLKTCNIYEYFPDPLYTDYLLVLRTNDEYNEEKSAGNADKYVLRNTDFDIIIEKLEILNDILLAEKNDSTNFIKAVLDNSIFMDANNKKIEESELLILLNNSTTSSTFTELPGVLNKKNALNLEPDGVIPQLKEKINVYEEEEAEVKDEFNKALVKLKNKISDYNSQINPRLAYIELKRLLSYPQSLKNIEAFYSNLQDSINEEIIVVEDRINNTIMNYINAYNSYYNLTVQDLDDIKTYIKIKGDKEGDEELDDFLDEFIINKQADIFFNIYILKLLKNKIEELDTDNKYTISNINDLKVVLANYSASAKKIYESNYDLLSSKINKITAKEAAQSTVDFNDKKEAILLYDDLLILYNALRTNSVSTTKKPNTFLSNIQSYIANLTLPQIKEINSEKNILSAKISLIDSSDPEDIDDGDSEIALNVNAYFKFIFNPLSSTLKDTAYIGSSFNSNLNYYNSLSSDTERKEILDNANKLITKVLEYVSAISLLVKSKNNYVVDSSGKESGTKICSYIDTKYLNADYSIQTISDNYITPLNEAIGEFNSLIIDYVYDLKDILNKYILINTYVPGVDYYYYNNSNKYVKCNSSFNLNKDTFGLGPKKIISNLNDNNYYAQLLSYIIAKYNNDYDYNCNINNSNTYLLPTQSTSSITKYILSDTLIHLAGENNDNTGFLNWYIKYIIQDGMNELLKLLEQAELLLSLYTDLYNNYYEKCVSTYQDKYNEYAAVYNGYQGTEELAFYEGTGNKTVKDYREQVLLDWINFVNILDIEYTREAERGMYI